MVKALFITRAQPFHKGHLHAIKEAMKKFDELVIGIGSSNESNTWKNPFSFEERVEMIKRAGVRCKVIGIPDVESDKKWVKQILEMEDFDVVITGSEWVKRCFSGIKEVRKPNFLLLEIYNGTRIKEKIVRDEEWEDLVPRKVANFIKKLGGTKRIKKLAEKELEF
ncbi:MAG: nicotinamide-nucleotide adenylyltransferase [Candidatus Aenigmarchaeota archaeon]|nr:nicotinamide-nucleotide adenylyltransferase [Candidatus Aenigmarchaeota archaeon]